ncbi:MAG: protein FxsA [Campylobacterota bacterium]|nr:protein FxsA [Campylobacterota bacterium]
MIVYFLIYLFVEVMAISQFIQYFGGLIFFIEIVVSFIVGALILSNFKYAIVEQLNNFAFGRINYAEFVSVSAFTLIGAVLLMIPGILTDVVGIVMQFEFFAIFIKRILFKNNIESEKKYNNKRSEDDYIDVEIVENDKNNSSNFIER